MNVSAPFVTRPVATSLLGVAILLCGLFGYLRLPVSSLPQVDFPTIQVTTQLPGANPDTVASLLTAPLERQFGQIPALESLASSSAFGLSQITLRFALDRDIDGAAQDVQSAINAAASTLPRGLPYPPTYAKVNPADTPVLTLALSSTSRTIRELSDLADTLLAQRLSEVSGVGRVSIEGGVRPAVRIQADLARLASYRIALEDLRVAVANANVAGPKGSLDGAAQSYTIAANDQIAATETYRTLVVAYRVGRPVLLGDVAEVVEGLENSRVGGWYGGEPAVVIDVQRQPGANIVGTVDRIREELPRLLRAMPAGVALTVVHDRTDTIRASIRDVQWTLVVAAGLVVLVVFLFLRTWRATIIAGIALPLSLIATFGVMWLVGFSLDNLSLMALTIGTGFVVDDAIVMIENVVRKLEEGASPLEAALEGSREIGFTVISLTASLLAVFIPLLFMSGLVGRMFREFALTLSIAVVVSAAISLTLTPMLCALWLGPAPREDRVRSAAARRGARLVAAAEAPFGWLAAGYRRSLALALARRGLMLGLTLATLAVTVGLYAAIPKGFLPDQDTGLLDVVLEGAPDASFAEMARLQGEASAIARRDPAVAGAVAVAGVGTLNPTANVAHLAVSLVPHDARTVSAAQVGERLRGDILREVAGAVPYVRPVPDIQVATNRSRSQYQYTLSGPDADGVTAWAARLRGALSGDAALRNVALETPEGGLRAHLIIDRDKAGRVGVTAQAITDTLNSAFAQRQISTIYAQANQYRVILEASPRYQGDPSALAKLYVGAVGGAQVPLDALTRVERRTAPLAIAHQDQFPAATISFDLAPGAALGTALRAIAAAERAVDLPGSISTRFAGDAAEFSNSLAGEPWLILAAVVAIYIVLGVLYESFVHPVTILSTLPSAGVGALLALWASGHDLSIVALIGIVLLMGIVKKNAIMMIDFALQAEREEGLSPEEAIVRACLLRFRPIMMTTLAALFGALPLALATGAGAELRVPLGVTIVGGLVLSQVLTLYTTPVIYLAFEGLRVRLSRAPREAPRLAAVAPRREAAE